MTVIPLRNARGACTRVCTARIYCIMCHHDYVLAFYSVGCDEGQRKKPGSNP